MRNKILVSELSKVFDYNPWQDILEKVEGLEEYMCADDIRICKEEVIGYNGRFKIPKKGYSLNHNNVRSRRHEHIIRIKSLMLANPEMWKPISINTDWLTLSPILEDGHHRLMAAQFMNLESINVELGGLMEIMEEYFPESYKLKLFN